LAACFERSRRLVARALRKPIEAFTGGSRRDTHFVVSARKLCDVVEGVFDSDIAMEKAEGERKSLEYSAAADGDDLMAVGPKVQAVPDDGGGYGFLVEFKLGGDAAAIDDGFPAQLRLWAARYDLDPVVTLMVIIPASFPLTPPRVRVVAPLLVHGSTPDFLNGVPIMPTLMPEGWNASTELITVMQYCREKLLFGDAVIAMDAPVCAMFPAQAAQASLHRLRARPTPAIAHSRPFQREFTAYSARFLLESLHLDVPEGLDMGNKVRGAGEWGEMGGG